MFEERFEARVRHLYSRCHTTENELALAETLRCDADFVVIAPILASDSGATCEVTVGSPEAVLHFYQFRNHYEGGASRALVALLAHYHIDLPLQFLLAHPSLLIDIPAHTVVAEEIEYAIAERLGVFVLVERVEWEIASGTLDALERWATNWDMPPEVLIELSVSLIEEGTLTRWQLQVPSAP